MRPRRLLAMATPFRSTAKGSEDLDATVTLHEPSRAADPDHWQGACFCDAVQADLVGTYSKTPKSSRRWCKSCGGHLFTDHPLWGVTDVYAASIPAFPYRPGLHVNYQETKLRMRDGLPKMKDMPKEMGGSGETLPE
jgi:hypothetical protein